MFETRAGIGAVVIVASLLYGWLASIAIGQAFAHLPGHDFVLSMIESRRVAAHVWLQFAHTLALVVAAIPAAALILLTSRRRQVAIALVVGAITAIVPVALSAPSGVFRDTTAFYATIMFLDHVKVMLILPGVVWLGKSSALFNADVRRH